MRWWAVLACCAALAGCGADPASLPARRDAVPVVVYEHVEPGPFARQMALLERAGCLIGSAEQTITATLADTVSFFPRPFLPSGREVATTQLNVSYVRAARVGDTLTARAEVLHLGRRTASLAIRITDQEGRFMPHGTSGLMFLDAPTDP